MSVGPGPVVSGKLAYMALTAAIWPVMNLVHTFLGHAEVFANLMAKWHCRVACVSHR